MFIKLLKNIKTFLESNLFCGNLRQKMYVYLKIN